MSHVRAANARIGRFCIDKSMITTLTQRFSVCIDYMCRFAEYSLIVHLSIMSSDAGSHIVPLKLVDR